MLPTAHTSYRLHLIENRFVESAGFEILDQFRFQQNVVKTENKTQSAAKVTMTREKTTV